jgi:hypothetical protein
MGQGLMLRLRQRRRDLHFGGLACEFFGLGGCGHDHFETPQGDEINDVTNPDILRSQKYYEHTSSL